MQNVKKQLTEIVWGEDVITFEICVSVQVIVESEIGYLCAVVLIIQMAWC